MLNTKHLSAVVVAFAATLLAISAPVHAQSSDRDVLRERIDQVVASKKNTRVNLENPITVMLLYWTAWADAEGTVSFRKDVYNRDPAIIKGLDEPFRFSLPQGAQEAFGSR